MESETVTARRPRRAAAMNNAFDPDEDQPVEANGKARKDKPAKEKVAKEKPAKDKPAKKGAKAAKDDSLKRFRVGFGGVSIGDNTCRLGVKLLRDVVKVSEADEYFCGRRINCRVKMHRSDEDPDQQHFDEMDSSETVEAVCDVKRYAVGPKDISIGLSFNLVEIHIEQLARFAKQSGTLEIMGVTSLDEIADDDD